MKEWLVTFRRRPEARVRLFCIPHAGGTASAFAPWLDHLPPSIELCAIQLPGRASRLAEAPFTRMAPLVDALADAMTPVLDRPFACFGHSMGALVSFELAHCLERAARPMPMHLFVSGAGAPRRERRWPALRDVSNAAWTETLERLGGTPAAVLENREMRDLLAPALRADFAVCETYVYRRRPKLSCPITAFGGRRDASVPAADLDAWAAETTANVVVRRFAGGHFFLHEAVPAVVDAVQDALLSTTPDAPGRLPTR